MNKLRHLLVLSACASLFIAGASLAEEAPAAKPVPKDIVLRDDAKCTSCHDEADSPQLLQIGKTRHGVNADHRTPTCTSCHGESDAHLKHKGSSKPPKPDRTFGAGTKTLPGTRNQACLSCHEKDSKRHLWQGSTHEIRDVACSNCHQIHTDRDKVRDKRTQPEVCFTCHKEQRAQIDKPSHHPIPEGKITCSDCHNAHGSPGPKLLVKRSVNATCFTCHAEKRGPFLHNHSPVVEDCGNCHNPHGTVANSLLKTRPPFLCQQCHDPANHLAQVPGVAGRVDTNRLATGNPSLPSQRGINTMNSVGETQGRSCMNCHTQIHGSNSPANSSRAARYWQ